MPSGSQDGGEALGRQLLEDGARLDEADVGGHRLVEEAPQPRGQGVLLGQALGGEDLAGLGHRLRFREANDLPHASTIGSSPIPAARAAWPILSRRARFVSSGMREGVQAATRRSTSRLARWPRVVSPSSRQRPSGARSTTGEVKRICSFRCFRVWAAMSRCWSREQLLEERARGEVVARLDAPAQARHHAADLVVEDELLQALAALEVEHAGPGDAVDAGERGEHRAHAGLEPGLGVQGLRVGERDVALGRQPQALADLRVRAVEHHRLDGAHRRRLVADVEDGGRAAPDDGRARPRRAGSGRRPRASPPRAARRCPRASPGRRSRRAASRRTPRGCRRARSRSRSGSSRSST